MGTQWTPSRETPQPSYQPGPAYSAASTFELAGFWRRLAAFAIDIVILGVVNIVVATALSAATGGGDLRSTQSISSTTGFILGLVYFGFLWSWRGQSVGYMALGIRLVRTDGSAVGLLRAAGRFILIDLSFLLCAIPALVSAFMIGTGERKQALHDKIVDTSVVLA